MIEQREDGLYVDGVKVFVRLSAGMLHCMVRAVDEKTFWVQAQAVMLVEDDPDRGLVARKGITVQPLGPLYDTSGETPVLVDSRFHANFWLGPDWVERGDWAEWAWAWSVLGSDADANKDETAKAYNGIELIDPATVSTPVNVLL